MVAVEAIMTGAGFATAVLAYITFKLNESENEVIHILSNLFFVITLSFILFLVWGGMQIAENNTLTYLTSGLVALLNVVMWVLILIMVGFTINIIWLMVIKIVRTLTEYNENLRRGKR